MLTASGLIAGEAMAGLLIAAYRFRYAGVPKWEMPKALPEGSLAAAALAGLVLLALAALMIQVPLSNAGAPDEPAPPTAVM